MLHSDAKLRQVGNNIDELAALAPDGGLPEGLGRGVAVVAVSLGASILGGITPSSAGAGEVVVEQGDNLTTIATAQGTTPNALLALDANAPLRADPDLLHPGDHIHTPVVSTEQPAPATTPSNYDIQQGDTLFKISQRIGVSIEVLKQLNNITNPDLIYAGESLITQDTDNIVGSVVTEFGPGENFYAVATRLGAIPEVLIAQNPQYTTDGRDPKLVFPGETVVYMPVPNSPVEQLAPIVATPTELANVVAQPDMTYAVQKGDTVWDLIKNGVTNNDGTVTRFYPEDINLPATIDAILIANPTLVREITTKGLVNIRLGIGQELILPAIPSEIPAALPEGAPEPVPVAEPVPAPIAPEIQAAAATPSPEVKPAEPPLPEMTDVEGLKTFIWYYLTVNKGLSPMIAAAFMGNMQAESNFGPARIQGEPMEVIGDDPLPGRGFGTNQWTYHTRQQGLKDMAQASGVAPNYLPLQLEHMMAELQGSYRKAFDNILAAKSIEEASDAVMVYYLSPKNQSESAKEERREFARAIFSQFNTPPPEVTPAPEVVTPAPVGEQPVSAVVVAPPEASPAETPPPAAETPAPQVTEIIVATEQHMGLIDQSSRRIESNGITTIEVKGIRVSEKIADQLARMLTAASEAGFDVTASSAFRSPEEQRALRGKNCSDPVNSRPSDCSPATAYPDDLATAEIEGSLHQSGEALDVGDRGKSLTSWSQPLSKWLDENAPKFGFNRKVKTEPWHISPTGH